MGHDTYCAEQALKLRGDDEKQPPSWYCSVVRCQTPPDEAVQMCEWVEVHGGAYQCKYIAGSIRDSIKQCRNMGGSDEDGLPEASTDPEDMDESVRQDDEEGSLDAEE